MGIKEELQILTKNALEAQGREESDKEHIREEIESSIESIYKSIYARDLEEAANEGSNKSLIDVEPAEEPYSAYRTEIIAENLAKYLRSEGLEVTNPEIQLGGVWCMSVSWNVK